MLKREQPHVVILGGGARRSRVIREVPHERTSTIGRSLSPVSVAARKVG